MNFLSPSAVGLPGVIVMRSNDDGAKRAGSSLPGAPSIAIRRARRRLQLAASLAVCAPVAAQIQGVPIPLAPGTLFTTPPLVSRAGDTVHVILNEMPYPGVGQYRRSRDRGRTWSAPMSFWAPVFAIAAAGPRVYAFGSALAWHSADDGATWSSGPSPTGSFVGSVHAAGLECHVLSGGVYSRTLDGGATWSAPRVVGPTTSNSKMVVEGSTIHVCTNVALSSGATFYQRSTDNGATWLASPMQVGTTPAGAVDLAVSGNHVHVLRTTNPTEYWRSTDSGATWLPPITAPNSHAWARLAVAGSNVYVMLQGPVFGLPGVVVVLRSNDDGATWNGSSLSGSPIWSTIGASGSVVCAAWSEPSQVQTIATSTDAGATWQSSTGGSGNWWSERSRPIVSVRPPVVAVLWSRADWLGPGFVVYPTDLDVSGDNGATWHLRETLGWRSAWCLAEQDGTAILWGDMASGSTTLMQTLYYGTVHGHERFGSSKPGTGGIAPVLQLQNTPLLGNNLTVTVANTVGGTTTLLGTSFAGEAGTPLGSGVLLLALPAMGTWGVASGAPGLAGAGSLSIPFAIPNLPVLHRQRVTFQGFAVDANAADGFSSTAGLTMVIL